MYYCVNHQVPWVASLQEARMRAMKAVPLDLECDGGLYRIVATVQDNHGMTVGSIIRPPRNVENKGYYWMPAGDTLVMELNADGTFTGVELDMDPSNYKYFMVKDFDDYGLPFRSLDALLKHFYSRCIDDDVPDGRGSTVLDSDRVFMGVVVKLRKDLVVYGNGALFFEVKRNGRLGHGVDVSVTICPDGSCRLVEVA